MSFNTQPYRMRTGPSFGSRIKSFVQDPSWLNRMIVINVAVYLLTLLCGWILSVAGFLMQFDGSVKQAAILRWLSCPASFETWLHQPWSIVTSLFLHSGFWHLFFNMFMLYVIGKYFFSRLNEQHFLWVYFLGGLVGNLLYMAAYNLFPAFEEALPYSYAVGASGCVMAVMAAITLYEPNFDIYVLLFGKMKLWSLTLIFIAIDLISIPKGNAGGHIAHIGGVLMGLLYIFLYKLYTKYSDGTFSSTSTSKRKKKYYVSKESGRPISDEDFNERKAAEKQRIDSILDKISANGYASLTEDEKDFLFHYSNKS
ncbi:MAG: rhomboid family intramembrane serine protease [Bacteroidales bacterium]|nr:rhomboid family intramembrane serine protease [Bacteroidales bacterium]